MRKKAITLLALGALAFGLGAAQAQTPAQGVELDIGSTSSFSNRQSIESLIKQRVLRVASVTGLELVADDGARYRLHPAAKIQWSTGATARTSQLRPGHSVSVKLFDPLVPVPVVSHLEIHTE